MQQPREATSGEPSSPGGTVRKGSGQRPARPAPVIGGLRYQPHKVTPQSSESSTPRAQQAQQQPSQPRFRIQRVPRDVPARSDNPGRDNADQKYGGAGQARPASRQRAAKRRSRVREEVLPDPEEEAAELDEAALAAEAGADITEEELAAAQRRVVQKHSGALAASHGEPSNAYMQARATAIADRNLKHAVDEKTWHNKAILRLRKKQVTFSGKGPLGQVNETDKGPRYKNRASHNFRARALPHMLALQRTNMANVMQLRHDGEIKKGSLRLSWLLGRSDKIITEEPDMGSAPSAAALNLRSIVDGKAESNSSYSRDQRISLLENINKVAQMARL